MPEQSYSVTTMPLPTPGDHWASGKLLGNATDSCAEGTVGPLVSSGWLFCLGAGTEPTVALAQHNSVAGRLEFCQALPNTRRRVFVLFLVALAFRPFNVDHHVVKRFRVRRQLSSQPAGLSQSLFECKLIYPDSVELCLAFVAHPSLATHHINLNAAVRVP